MATLFKVVRPQIHFAIEGKIRINKTGQQIKSNDLGEKDGEATKIPVMLIAQTEHRPPGLHTDKKKKAAHRCTGQNGRTRARVSIRPRIPTRIYATASPIIIESRTDK